MFIGAISIVEWDWNPVRTGGHHLVEGELAGEMRYLKQNTYKIIGELSN